MKDAILVSLIQHLKALKLSSMASGIEAHLRQAKESGIGYDEFLLDLATTELQVRSENRMTRRIRDAKFPLLKPVETFDLNAVPELDIRLFRDLCGCDYIKKHRNVIFLGRSGAGKSHLATALGIEACKANYRTRIISCYGLVNELIEAREARDLIRLIQRYSR